MFHEGVEGGKENETGVLRRRCTKAFYGEFSDTCETTDHTRPQREHTASGEGEKRDETRQVNQEGIK